MNMYETFAHECNIEMRSNTAICERIELLRPVNITCMEIVRKYNDNKKLALKYDTGNYSKEIELADMNNGQTYESSFVISKAIDAINELIKENVVRILLNIKKGVNNAKI